MKRNIKHITGLAMWALFCVLSGLFKKASAVDMMLGFSMGAALLFIVKAAVAFMREPLERNQRRLGNGSIKYIVGFAAWVSFCLYCSLSEQMTPQAAIGTFFSGLALLFIAKVVRETFFRFGIEH